MSISRVLELVQKDHLEKTCIAYHFENGMLQSNSFICNEKITFIMRFNGCIEMPMPNMETYHKDFERDLKVGTEKIAHFSTRMETVYPYHQTQLTMTITDGIPHHDFILEEIPRVINLMTYSSNLRLVDYQLWVEYTHSDCMLDLGGRAVIFKSSRSEEMPKRMNEYFEKCFQELKVRITNDWDPENKSKIAKYEYKISFFEPFCPCEGTYEDHFDQLVLGKLRGKYEQMCNNKME